MRRHDVLTSAETFATLACHLLLLRLLETKMKFIALIFALSVISSVSSAQSLGNKKPETREAKRERCTQLARDRGWTARTRTGAGSMGSFIGDCMKGKQS
jgi:hypothetical protein